MSSATITVQPNNRISVDMKFKQNFDEIIKFFRTIEKRFWDAEKRLWSFPKDSLKQLTDGLEALDVDIEFEEFKPFVEIIEHESDFLLRLNCHISDIAKKLNGAKWDQDFKLYKFPNEELENCQNELAI